MEYDGSKAWTESLESSVLDSTEGSKRFTSNF